MSTPVLILSHNNLALTKKCVESALAQSVPTSVMLIDNGSSDGTQEWAIERGLDAMFYPTNKGVSFGWNVGLDILFGDGETAVLVVNNDTVLPSYFLKELAAYGMMEDADFITGTSVGTMEEIAVCPKFQDVTPNPDFSAFLISRVAWEKIGAFDGNMVFYASDCDYHVRGHQAGVRMVKAAVPFYHERSSTMKNADPAERAEINARANADRQAFRDKWGCTPGDPAYGELFK